jgi:hypothetical protein
MSIQDPIQRDIVPPSDGRYPGLLAAQAAAGATAARIQRAQREHHEPSGAPGPLTAQTTGPGDAPSDPTPVQRAVPKLKPYVWGIALRVASVAFLLGAVYDAVSGAHSPLGSLVFAVGCFLLARLAFAVDAELDHGKE